MSMTPNRAYGDADAMRMADELREMRQAPKGEVRVKSGSDFQSLTIRSGYVANPDDEVAIRQSQNPNSVEVRKDDGSITIRGVSMTRASALASGLITPEEANRPATYSFNGETLRPFVDSPEPQEQGQGEQQPEAASGPVEDAGNQALDELSQGFAGDSYATAMEAAESGDYDAIAQAHGLDAAKVAIVVAGATARADRTIADLGVNSATLSAVLDGGELAEARRAVVQGDDVRLRGLASYAVDKLSTMPNRDPAKFRALIAQHFSEIETDVGPGGQFLMNVEGMGFVPWATVVRLGGVKLK